MRSEEWREESSGARNVKCGWVHMFEWFKEGRWWWGSQGGEE